MISLSKCDHAGEMPKIGAFPPKLSIDQLFEKEHGNYDPKLYKIKVAHSTVTDITFRRFFNIQVAAPHRICNVLLFPVHCMIT